MAKLIERCEADRETGADTILQALYHSQRLHCLSLEELRDYGSHWDRRPYAIKLWEAENTHPITSTIQTIAFPPYYNVITLRVEVFPLLVAIRIICTDGKIGGLEFGFFDCHTHLIEKQVSSLHSLSIFFHSFLDQYELLPLPCPVPYY